MAFKFNHIDKIMKNRKVKELKFSQVWPEKMGEWAGKETGFKSKIWAMLHDDHGFFQYGEMAYEWNTDYNDKIKESSPKLHTIRRGQKYKAGDIVKPISVSPDGKEFQFAPEMEIVSVQDIEIKYRSINGFEIDASEVFIDRYNILNRVGTLSGLVKNDGFEFIDQFLQYFNENFHGQILHFTELKY